MMAVQVTRVGLAISFISAIYTIYLCAADSRKLFSGVIAGSIPIYNIRKEVWISILVIFADVFVLSAIAR